jgi:hypothetical protein
VVLVLVRQQDGIDRTRLDARLPHAALQLATRKAGVEQEATIP